MCYLKKTWGASVICSINFMVFGQVSLFGWSGGDFVVFLGPMPI